MGGTIFIAFSILVVSLLLLCAPIGAACGLLCWRSCCRPRGRKAREREEAIDRLVAMANRGAARGTLITNTEVRPLLVEDDELAAT